MTIYTDWAWHQWDHLYGTFTYGGQPVFGFKSKPSGEPLDTFGRNVYVDTFNSAYGTGWKRENSFLVHNPTGVFCYGFNPHGARPAGKGRALPRDDRSARASRRTSTGQGTSPGTYDRDADLVANDAITQLGDKTLQGELISRR